MRGLLAVIELLDEGGTVPFIARYRKEATGNLDEVQIRNVEEKSAYFLDLVSRRETILASIAEQGKLTDELTVRIQAAFDKSELEDLYLPFRPSAVPKRPSLAKKASNRSPNIYGHSSLGSSCWRNLPLVLSIRRKA